MTDASLSCGGYIPTARTSPTRKPDRAAYDAETVHAVLDADFLCHVGFLADDGPVVLPTLYARSGELLYLHGSSGGRLLLLARDGIEVCVTVTLLDGLVLARSAMHHSANYRSVVVRGTARAITDPEEKHRALELLVDHVVPGRAADTRPPSDKELAATGVLRLDLVEVSAKTRSGGVNDEPEDLTLPHWAGVVDVQRVMGAVRAAPDLGEGVATPGYLTALATRIQGASPAG